MSVSSMVNYNTSLDGIDPHASNSCHYAQIEFKVGCIAVYLVGEEVEERAAGLPDVTKLLFHLA